MQGLPGLRPRCRPLGAVASRTETQWQLACPRGGFIVGGLDAELTNRALDLVFRATLGSPVNPGVSTSTTADFLGRLSTGRDPAASFRPHVGCIPATGGGSRVPTARRVFPPGRPTVVRASEVALRAGSTRRVSRSCKAGEELVAASHAVGFYGAEPPTRALASAVHVTGKAASGKVALVLRAGRAVAGTRTVVQIDLTCASGS